jgi:hypothetical protein
LSDFDPQTNPEHAQMVRELLAEVFVDLHRDRVLAASGWVYVVVDDESGDHVHVVGPFDGPEAAVIASERQKIEDRRMNPGEPLWTHHVLPLFSDEGKS